MKKNLLCLALLANYFNVFSQQISIGGSGATSSHLYGPLYTQSGGARSYRSAFIYPESLLSGMIAGSGINQLQFSRSNAGPVLPAGNNLKLYLLNSTSSGWGAAALPWNVSSATLVYDGDPSAVVGTTVGFKIFPLISGFTYTGDNLVLFSEYSQLNAPTTTISWHYNTPATQPAYQADQLKYAANNSTTLPTSLSTTIGNHANMIIDYTAPPPCSAPMAGAAVASTNAAVCGGALVKLTLSGNSMGTGQTYSWQSFATAGGPYTDISSPSASAKLDINPASTLLYRAAVTCASTTVYSDSVEVRVAALFPGGVYTINSAVATGGTNFSSFTDAVNAIRCGITGAVTFNVNAAGGPYNEQVTIPQITGVSATSRIVFNGNGRQLSFAQNGTGPRAVITLDGADYVTIDNLVINAAGGTYGWGIQALNNADNNTISSNTIMVSTTSTVNADHAGIIVGGSATSPTATGNAGNNNTITGNTMTGGYYGIVLTGNSTGAKSLNNAVSDNAVTETYSYSIYAANQSGAVIISNDISRPTRTNSTTTAGVYLATGNVATLVESNRIHNMFAVMPADASILYAIHIASDGLAGQENRIVNNLVYDNNFNGIFYGIYNTGADYMLAYHNTITAIDASVATTGGTYGLFIAGATSGVDFRNNIMYIDRSGTGIKRAFYFVTITSTITSNNNNVVFDTKSGGSDNHTGQWGTSLFITLADWKTANSNAYDQLSTDIDPIFTDPSTGNFLPREPVVSNIGAPVGVTTDIVGIPRSATAPDAGAYEFTPPPCVAPPVAGVSVATPAGVACPSHDVILSLSGNSLGAGQTYQWQSSATLNGVYTNISSVSDFHTVVINPTATMFYRAVVTCGGNTEYSNPVQVVVASFFPAGTYTINSGAATGGTNFNSFTDAVNAIKCGVTGGVTFNVAAGSSPYTEQITIPYIAGATPANQIVFNGNGATIQFNSHTEGRHIIKLDGAKHIVFNNLNVVGLNSTFGWGFHLRNRADSNTINNCTIDMSAVTSNLQNNSAGIVASYASTNAAAEGNNANYTTITNNTIIGAYTGIGMYGQANAQLNRRTTITNNTIRDFYATGMLIMWTDIAVVANNNIHRANRTGTVGTFAGIEVRAGCKNVVINANRIHSSHNAGATQNGAAYGIFMNLCDAPDGQENKISNNLIHNLNSLAGTVYGLYNSTSDGVFYYHNTVVIDNMAATAGTTHGFSEQSNLGRIRRVSAHAHMTLLNNLFYVNRGGTGEKVVLSLLTSPNSVTSNRNNLYNASETGVNIGKVGSTIYPTMAAWQSVGYDQQSVSMGPLFVNPSSDFRPTAQAMNNLGQFVGVTMDFFGALRNTSTPDIGAIEFSGPLPVTLLSFTGEKQGAIHRLAWKTATEINNSGYELQRSADGANFTKLFFIPSKAVNGNSSNLLSYGFDDVSPLTGTNYYRLKQIDKDSTFSYSHIFIIRGGKPSALTMGFIHPNPVSDLLHVIIASPAKNKLRLLITDVSGRLLVQSTKEVVSGDNQIKLPVAHLASGTYFIKLIEENGTEISVQKFVKQ